MPRQSVRRSGHHRRPDGRRPHGLRGLGDRLHAGSLPGHHTRHTPRHRSRRTGQARFAFQAVPQNGGPRPVLQVARQDLGCGPVRRRRRRADSKLLRTVPAAALLCDSCADHPVRRDCADQHAGRRDHARLRAAHYYCHRHRIHDRRPRLQKILGPIHRHGCRIPRQPARPRNPEELRRRRPCRRRNGQEGRRLPRHDHARAADPAALADRHGYRGLRRCGGRHWCGSMAVCAYRRSRRRSQRRRLVAGHARRPPARCVRLPGLRPAIPDAIRSGLPAHPRRTVADRAAVRRILHPHAPTRLLLPRGDERHDLHQTDLRPAGHPRARPRHCHAAGHRWHRCRD